MCLNKIVIVGKSGAGKTTLAGQLSTKLSLKHVELDGIAWQKDWTMLSIDEFRNRVDKALASNDSWVADGNYTRRAQDIIWQRADTLIWLDYPLYLALWRVLTRTLGRIFWNVELWNGNRETFGHHLNFDPNENLFLFTIRMHKNHRADFPRVLAQAEYQHLKVLRFRHPRETEEWLSALSNPLDFGQEGYELQSIKPKNS
ncbi:hypothetical protein EJ08DRAFT_655081 [Tothia fuscella]|uniref:Adenylate kinase n=1 Tax=Tothia fuscella TaxID=1048955 RepID=A0A9P4U4F4_9PEZI|nr:hypothetical protein EJ08DRAFT_655081 [Tothia fuscella]